MKKAENVAWTFYASDEYSEKTFDQDKVGKWMYFFDDQYDLEAVDKLCQDAVKQGIVKLCKHTNFDSLGMNPHGTANSGVCCFYLNCDDIESHRRCLDYFLKNNMIKRTKAGKLTNIAFKLDQQTRAGEYGTDFKGILHLEQFVDLRSGEWIYRKRES